MQLGRLSGSDRSASASSSIATVSDSRSYAAMPTAARGFQSGGQTLAFSPSRDAAGLGSESGRRAAGSVVIVVHTDDIDAPQTPHCSRRRLYPFAQDFRNGRAKLGLSGPRGNLLRSSRSRGVT